MLRAVLYDFNGVLVDDEPVHLELFQQVLAEEGFGLSREDYYRRYLGFDDRGVFAAVLAAAGADSTAPRVARLVARKAVYYRDRIRRDGYPFFPGALDLVRATAARGWMLGVVSGALREEVERALAQGGIGELFKVRVTAEDVAASKPDPESYRLALIGLNAEPPLPERLVHPHEVVAIEDSPAGLESAAGAGLVSVAVAQTYPPDRLGAAAAVFASVADLSPERLEAAMLSPPQSL